MKINSAYTQNIGHLRSSQRAELDKVNQQQAEQKKQPQEEAAAQVSISKSALNYAKALSSYNDTDPVRSDVVAEAKAELENWQALSDASLDTIAQGILGEF